MKTPSSEKNEIKCKINQRKINILKAFPPLILGMASVPAHALNLVAGEDIQAQGLSKGIYDLILNGDVTWRTNFTITTSGPSDIVIDGRGKMITASSTATQRFLTLNKNNSNVTIKNATITSQPFSTGHSALFSLNTSNIVANLFLEGTVFQGIAPTSGADATSRDYGPIFSVRGGARSVLNIDGGVDGVLFKDNAGRWDQPGVAGVYATNTINFKGKVAFESNYTANYGGAVSIFEAGSSASPTTMTFSGETDFVNNHSTNFGGAVDLWGGTSRLQFDSVANFTGNYVYGTTTVSTEYPNNYGVTHSRGGAINVGYLDPGAGGAYLIFNNDTNFTRNFVIETKTATANRDALGGAVSAYGNGSNRNYFMNFDGKTIFDGNYVYSVSGSGHGGAIYYDAGAAATLNLGGGSSVTNNYASTLGGGVYLQTGTINLNANNGDITFQGNRHGGSFSSIGGGLYAPDDGSGTPNAIYLAGSSGSLNFNTDAGKYIYFYDPIASAAGTTLTINKTGDGEVIFYGKNSDANYNSDIRSNTYVNKGIFTLTDTVVYGANSAGAFTVNNGGVLQGGNASTLRAQTITVNTGGAIAGNGGIFNLDSGTGKTTSYGGKFTGFGTISATEISLSNVNTNITNADIADGDTLTLDTKLTGAGGLSKTGDGTLVLNSNTFTGTTTFAEGIVRANGQDVVGNSSAVYISDSVFQTNGFNQRLTNLTGSGSEINITDSAIAVISNINSQYDGTITGNGQLLKLNSGTFIVTGNNTYSGGTDVILGTLIATQGEALGTGTVNNGSTLKLDFANNSTMTNQLSGVGVLNKTGVGTATLSSVGSSQGTVNVDQGILAFTQNGAFNVNTYTTKAGATTDISADSSLNISGTYTQESSSTLNLAINETNPSVTANTANIGGILNVSGLNTTSVGKVSELSPEMYTVIHTTAGITGDFLSVNLIGDSNTVDYLTATTTKDITGFDYNVGFGLTWLAGAQQGNGTFTLANSGDTFDVDIILADQTSPFVSGWDGKSLTKAGDGTLTLSSANTYTGTTTVNGGILQTGAINAFANSSAVIVNSNSTLDLNNFNQIANDISGSGSITLGSATLTANSNTNTSFSGQISGTGALNKTGTGSLTLSNGNNFTGGSSLTAGTVIATNAQALGTGNVANNATLEVNFDGTLSNSLSGTGSLNKTGTGTVTLDRAGSTQGTVNVESGTLAFDQTGAFTAEDYTTKTGATTTIGADSALVVNDRFTQEAGATLNVALGSNQPIIVADTADLNGALNISGFTATAPNTASALTSTEFTIIQTANGITGDFNPVNNGGITTSVDYLTAKAGIDSTGKNYNVGFGLTWLAGAQQGNGTFTLANSGDTFDVDIILADQTSPFVSGWDGKSLTKAGDGTLTLSSANTYTGTTTVNGGILQTGAINAFANSSAVIVNSNSTLDLNNFNQIANDISGSGSITLGSATLTANSNTNTSFSGQISGTGALNKTGTGSLTLSNGNNFTGGSSLTAGTVIATNAQALGTGNVANNATLEVNFDGTLSNSLSGTGSLNKTGTGTVTLDRAGSTQGTVNVESGTLAFDQTGAFTAEDYTTKTGATTTIGADSALVVNDSFTQEAGATLNVALGSNQPIIVADTADLNGALNISGFTATAPNTASALTSTEFTIIQTANGITGDFNPVNNGGITTSVDYLTAKAGIDSTGKNYNVGFGLTWLAGAQQGNGTFTLANSGDTFDVDIILADQTSPFVSGWDGKSLTKAGDGTLTLSSANTYTGTTTVNGGILQTGAINAFANSSAVIVNSNSTLDLNNFNQIANDISGSGSITLGSATLTANSNTNTSFSGQISGTGALNKTGTGSLTLSNGNNFTGGSSLTAGTVIATNAQALGTGNVANNATLEVNFDGTLSNSLSGTGSLNKTGTGTVTLDRAGSTQGTVNVESGTLAFDQTGAFTAEDYTTKTGATTTIGADSALVVNDSFTQEAGATLNVALGSNQPIIVADTADLNGALNISGFTATAPNTASALTSTEFTIIQTANGITGDFNPVNNGGITTSVDYLTAKAGIDSTGKNYNVGFGLTWLAGAQQGNGTFTLANSGDTFDVDIILADQTSPFVSGWDGKSLTKAGDGTLTLSSANTYTGTTTVNGGILQTGAINAFANSSAVIVNSNSTLDLNNFNQIANDISGSGSITLGSATLTANSNTNTSFSGQISGTGALNKTGTGSLTLSNGNNFTGGSSLTAGTVIATNAQALGTGNVANNATLEVNFDGTLSNSLSGTGSLNKTGTGTVTLDRAGSTQGTVNVESGTLAFDQTGAFTAEDYTTKTGATTTIGADSALVVNDSFTQEAGATLNVALGSNQPIIVADTADLNGALNISGFTATAPNTASALTSTEFTIIQTANGITGDFNPVNNGGITTSVDYLTAKAGIDSTGKNYNVGFGLTWLAGAQQGNGTFTLANSGDTFDVDIILADQTSPFVSGWDGKSLTKAGDGTLTLSSANTYTGTTTVNGGILQTGAINAFANSSAVIVNSNSTLDLNNFNQIANDISGSGSITLGSATLTANSNTNTSFSGQISGTGALNKTGTGSLTLSNGNNFTGGSSLTAGTVIATNAQALGTGNVANNATLEVNFDGTLSNSLSGTGSLNKTGTGTVTLDRAGSTQGTVNVESGTLAFDQTGAFTAEDYTTKTGATTTIGADSALVVNDSFTQEAGATLNVALGSNQPIIVADTADLNGALNISGFTATAPNTASALTSTEFTIIQTANGITGDFNPVNNGGITTSVDYLTAKAGIDSTGKNYNVGFGLTWLAGAQQGNGTFTLANSGDTFDVDIILADQTSPFVSGWDGKSLTKAGDGTLTLSSANTYTGTTTVNGGILQTGAINAFANSSAVIVNSNSTLDLNNFNQIANDISGSGSITLGSATLTANSNTNTSFSGQISGTGALNKTGTGSLTLSNGNNFTGGSSLTAGTVIATNAQALGTGNVANNATLEVNFDGTLSNSLSGTGSLNKTGTGTVTLDRAGSTQGTVNVESGTLAFDQTGAFTAEDYTTKTGATTTIGADSALVVNDSFTQEAGATLNVALGSNQPIIVADTADLNGALNISGFTATAPNTASALTSTEFTIIQTANGITGDFNPVNNGGITTSVDYLTAKAGIDSTGKNYNVGFGLTWLAGAQQGNGTFTLANSGDTFDVDIILADQTSPFVSGWDGKSLTKAGDGTLTLSSANTYTGTTTVNGGILQTGAINAFANSSAVIVNSNSTLDLNNFNQIANDISGSGSITLGSATLTANSNTNTVFTGSMSGSGSLEKMGTGSLTLSGTNLFGGGTIIADGRLIGTNGSALGSGVITNNSELELTFVQNATLNNQLAGTGELIKSGTAITVLKGTGSSQGVVSVNGGTLEFSQNGTFNVDSNYLTVAGAETTLNANSTLVVGNEFEMDGTLNVIVGNNSPVIAADTTTLGSDSIFNISGYSASPTATATQLANSQFTVIETSTSGNLSGNFSEIDIGGSSTPVDYLKVSAVNNGETYVVGLGLSWYAAHTASPQDAHGTFTLANSSEHFDLDVVLADEMANAATGWDGKTLTKEGNGTLFLSQKNTYTGSTSINAGTLQTNIDNAFANSNEVFVNAGASLNLNSFDQLANHLSGNGNIVLGSATLTADNSNMNTTFGGVISGMGNLTKTGAETLILTNNSTYAGTTTISSGTLQLGNNTSGGSVLGDIVNNSLLVFDRNNTYLYGSEISGTGNIVQQGTGQVIFTKDQTYTGATDVNAGALILVNNAQITSTQTTTVAQGATLGGYGGVGGDVINNGLLAIADAAPGLAGQPSGTFTVGGNLTNNVEIRMDSIAPTSRLEINGNYIGNSGLLALSTVLGGDSSLTDKMIVHGNTSGNTRVVVNNAGGAGAQTTNGIQVIQVDGQSDGVFTLTNRVVVGAYEYDLYKGLPDAANGSWYLRSVNLNGEMHLIPEFGAYLGNQSLSNIMQSHTLFDRRGDNVILTDTSAWVRFVAGNLDSNATSGGISMDSDYSLVHFGGDIATYQKNGQQLQLGLMGSWGRGETRSKGSHNLNNNAYKADGDVNGYNVGAYATWVQDKEEQIGGYVDSWIQYGWYDNEVSGEGQKTEKYDSYLFSASLEAGYTFKVPLNRPVWQLRVTPQAQILFSDYSADSFTDSRNSRIKGQNNQNLSTRLGMRVSGMALYKNIIFQPYVETNWWHTTDEGKVSIDGISVRHDMPEDQAEFKLGIQGKFNNNWSGWVDINTQTDFDDHNRIGGSVGVRYGW